MNSHEFSLLYEQCADKAFSHVYFRVSDREKAKDIVQEAFVRLWKNAGDGEGTSTIDNPKAFLYRILNNLIIDHYRSKKHLSLDELEEGSGASEDEGNADPYGGRVPSALQEGGLTSELERFDAVVTSKQVRDAVLQLPPLDQRLVTLRFLDELDTVSVATELGMTENAVYVRTHRALKKLHALLADTPH